MSDPGNKQINADKLKEALAAFGASDSTPQNAQPIPLHPPEIARQYSDDSAAKQKYIITLLNDLEIGWSVEHVLGVELANNITYVPYTHSWVVGVASLRGTITSVVDLRQFLDLPSGQFTPASRIIVANTAKIFVGFLVDAVKEVSEIANQNIVYDTSFIHHTKLPEYAVNGTAVIPGSRRVIYIAHTDNLLNSSKMNDYLVK